MSIPRDPQIIGVPILQTRQLEFLCFFVYESEQKTEHQPLLLMQSVESAVNMHAMYVKTERQNCGAGSLGKPFVRIY